MPKRISPRLGAGAEARDLVEEPHKLRSRKVGVEDQARLLAHHVGKAEGAQLVAYIGGASALPYDRVVYRLPRRPIPEHDRLALVRDADRRYLIAFDLRGLDGASRGGELGRPYLLGIVLDPSRLREYLLEGNLL